MASRKLRRWIVIRQRIVRWKRRTRQRFGGPRMVLLSTPCGRPNPWYEWYREQREQHELGELHDWKACPCVECARVRAHVIDDPCRGAWEIAMRGGR
jgi:hypothetical protein